MRAEWLIGFSLVCMVSACGLFGPGEERVVGTIGVGDPHPEPVTSPQEAIAGTPFVVAVITFGNSCVRVGDTETTTTERSVRITPYDLTREGNETCVDVVNYFQHEVTLEFDAPGPVRLVFVGANVELEHRVDVR